MAINKNWALNQLRHARNSLFYAVAGMRLLNSPALETLTGRIVVFDPEGIIWDPTPEDRIGRRFEFPLDQLIADRDARRSDFDYSLANFYKFVRRNLVKETFECTKAYATSTGQRELFYAQSWFQFARAVRNAISHNFHFKFDAKDNARLPISWNGKTITAEMEGNEIPENMLDPYNTLALIEEMRQFVDAH